MAPTYFRREPGIEHSDGHRGPHLIFNRMAGRAGALIVPGMAKHGCGNEWLTSN